jgi:hypothetical protein
VEGCHAQLDPPAKNGAFFYAPILIPPTIATGLKPHMDDIF